MALTLQEKEAVKELKAQGYTNTQISGFIGGLRTNKTSTVLEDIQRPPEQPKTSFLEEAAGDIKQIGTDISQAAQKGATQISKIEEAEETGLQGPIRSMFQRIGTGAGFAARAVGETIKGGIKAVLPQRQEEQIKTALGAVIRPIIETESVQAGLDKAQEWFQDQDEATQRDIKALGGIGALALEITGTGAAVKASRRGLRSLISESDDVAKGIARGVSSSADDASKTVVLGTQSTPELARSLVTGSGKLDDVLFPVPDNVMTSARRVDVPTIEKYINQAQKAVIDSKAKTPLVLAGERATEALDVLQRKLRNVGKQKAEILEKAKVGNKPMGNVALKARQDLNRAFSGTTLDKADTNLINAINDELVLLGRNPTVKQVDDFIDFAQDQLYKASDNLTIKVSNKVTGQLRAMTGKLNSAVKETAGKKYTTLNDNYAEFIELRNKLNKALGPQADRGGSLMKRTFSPTDGGTVKMFKELEDITGIPLTDEAVMAKFSMEIFGDSRQASLLQAINVRVDRELKDRILQSLLGPKVQKGQVERLIRASKVGEQPQ